MPRLPDGSSHDVFGRASRGLALALVVLLVLGTVTIELSVVEAVVPSGPLGWLRRNSEAWVGAALLVVDLWLVPRSLRAPTWGAWMVGLAGLALAAGAVGPGLDVSDRFLTLKEPFAALLIVSPLLRWARGGDGQRVIATILAGAALVLACAVAGFDTVRTSTLGQVVVDQAETIGLVVLAVAFALVLHRWPFRLASRSLRGAFAAVAVAAPVAFSLVEHVEPGGVRFAQRTTEAFLAVLVLAALVEVSAARRGRTRSGTAGG